MADLELREVSKKYGTLTAVDNVSFKVNDGEFVAVLGPPGAGKTSILKMVAGVEDVTGGEVYIGGRLVNSLDSSERDVAMAFETYALYPHLTVFENIAFPLRAPARAKQYPASEVARRVTEVASILEIDALLQRKPKELSGGQRQRVSLARMLVRDPKVFLMDEPIAHLDAKLRHRLRGEIKRIQQARGITTLYTTTDYLEAFGMGDRIAILHKGVLQQLGAWQDIYNCPATTFIATIVSDPPMNFFDCEAVGEGDAVIFKTPCFSIQADGKLADLVRKSRLTKLILGIFPSKVAVTPGEAGEGSHSVPGSIELVQHRGARKVLLVRMNGDEIRVQVPLESGLNVGDKVSLLVDKQSIQLFDPRSEKNISVA